MSSSVRESALSDRRFMIANALVSGLAVSFLGWLLLRRSGGSGAAALSFMPAVNASLNACAALLLLAGFRAIRTKNRRLHKRLMISAFCASSLFLLGYIIYHYTHGDTKFLGQGVVRYVYFSVLITHVPLSMTVVPLALSAFYYAFQARWVAHKKITRFLYPIWLYVSVTGVVIFFMLRGNS